MSPTSVLLLTGSLQTGNCIMLCWTSYFALTDTRAKIWFSGSSKCCALMTFAYDLAAFAEPRCRSNGLDGMATVNMVSLGIDRMWCVCHD